MVQDTEKEIKDDTAQVWAFHVMSMDTEMQSFLVDKEMVEIGDIEDAKERYRVFLEKISEEWTNEKIKDFAVNRLRFRYKNIADKMKSMEESNYDDRRNGVSFSKRKLFSQRIGFAEKLLVFTKEIGVSIKRKGIVLQDIVTADDWPQIEKRGFERFLIRYVDNLLFSSVN